VLLGERLTVTALVGGATVVASVALLLRESPT
jgi:drug/metabolite transporter (DMT)-like permease